MCFRAKLTLFVTCVLGLLGGYDVVDLPSIPGAAAVGSRWEQLTDEYTQRVGCSVRQVRVLSAAGEPSEDRLRSVERYCGTSLPSQPR